MPNNLNQTDFWESADGLTRLIDDLDDRHRGNIAAWLVNRAAYYHWRMCRRQIESDYWGFMIYAQEAWERGSWGPCTDPEPTHREIRDEVRKRQAKGEHLDWMRSTPLFQRMIRGLEILPPGTL